MTTIFRLLYEHDMNFSFHSYLNGEQLISIDQIGGTIRKKAPDHEFALIHSNSDTKITTNREGVIARELERLIYQFING